jgi:hypothetical protein
MSRTAALAGAIFVVAGLNSASAQSWSFGVGVGFGPSVYGPPPVHGPPVYGEPEPPAIYAPASPVPSAVPPDVVFDMLEEAGYREFSPMAFRDGVYKLNAVNRRGDLVALEVSAITGAIESEFLMASRETAPLPAPPAPPAVQQAPSNSGSGDPLVVY